MKSNILAIALLVGILSAIVPVFSQSVYAQSKSPVSSELKTATPLKDALAQAEPIKITGVKIVDNQIVIETASGATLSQLTSQTQGKLSYTDIPNAILALPDGKEFRVENPTEGIANIAVTQVTANYVRVLLTGISTSPPVTISSSNQGLTIGFGAVAQGSTTATAPEEGEIEITVRGDRKRNPSTASKTDTPLRDIPASVQVIPQETIKNTGSTTLDTIIKSSPSIQQTGGGRDFSNVYIIRGLNQSFLRDGIPDGLTTNGAARTLTDIESVEILKGSSSSLFGSSSPGGSINLITKKPQATPASKISLTTGSFGAYGTSVDFTGPLNGDNSLLYRFNGAYSKLDGYRGLGNNVLEVLPKVTWKPNEFNNINFNFDYRNSNIVADSNGILFRGTEILNVPLTTRYYTPFSNANQISYRTALNHEWKANPDLLVRNNFVVAYRDLYLGRNAGGGFRTTTNPDGSSNYLLNTQDNRIFREHIDRSFDFTYQTEAVLKATTGSIKHTILGGIEYQNKNYSSVRDSVSFAPTLNVFNPVLETARSQNIGIVRNFDVRQLADYGGVYLQDQVELSDQLKVRVGGRFDIFGLSRTGNVLTGTVNDSRSYAKSPTAFSYQAGLVYQPIRELSLYASTSKNYVAPFTTEGITSVFDPPESALQYEVGAKTEFFDGRLAANVTFFDVTRENFIITIGAERVPIGAQSTKGVELELNAKPVDGWTLSSGLSLYDAKLTNLPNARILEGNRPTNVPNAAASLGTSYEIQSGSLKGFGFGGGLTYRDSIFATNDNRRVIPGFTTMDLLLFYRKDDFDAQLNFYNVTNAAYFRNSANSGAAPGTPFAVTATVGFKF